VTNPVSLIAVINEALVETPISTILLKNTIEGGGRR
jgi:hypothetical protein